MKIYFPSREIHDMTDTTVDVVSTSATTADASPIVLAQTEMLRLKFLPTLIDNGKDPQKSVSGKLLYEKKRKGDERFPSDSKDTSEKVSRGSVKVCDWMEFKLSTSETYALYEGLQRLYALYDDMGKIPYGTATYARVDGAFRQFLSIIQNDPAAARMIGNEENYDLVKTLLRLITQTSSLESLKKSLSELQDDNLQYLVDVDEDHDISSAYRMDNEDFPFGYEFVRKATLREINFGESDMTGEKLSVSGVEEVRKGFRICKYCGKIQPENGKANHSFACKTRKMPTLMQVDAYEECLFLYREFSTEILRLLVPATTMDSSSVKMESFVAAFMLGMKEYFGNVDHLRATVSEVPVPDADYRKQYLVIYDSVPGGTGYLKQLMHEKNALIEIFEKALHVMENCSCKDDPQKDGCYHCLYAYRQSQQIGNISRTTAIRILKSILSGKDNVQKIDKINDIPVAVKVVIKILCCPSHLDANCFALCMATTVLPVPAPPSTLAEPEYSFCTIFLCVG